ncbi:hypothetical protein Z043-103069 [Arapaima gigas]
MILGGWAKNVNTDLQSQKRLEMVPNDTLKMHCLKPVAEECAALSRLLTHECCNITIFKAGAEGSHTGGGGGYQKVMLNLKCRAVFKSTTTGLSILHRPERYT